MKFNGVEITQESILTCRQCFAEIADTCVRMAEDGTAPLPSHYPLELYRIQKGEDKRKALAGEYDHSFTFMQEAYYIQTGKSIPLLP